MPLTSWIKNISNAETPPEKAPSQVVADALLMELDYQMKEQEDADREKERERKRSTYGVDYDWLTNSRQYKYFEMAQLERLEMEELCIKIRPEESGRVIAQFREALLREPSIDEMPRILRACLLQVLEGRPKDESMGDWMRKSLTSLRSFRPSTAGTRSRVTPIDDDGDLHGRSSTSSSSQPDSLFFTKVDHHFPVDDLPV